MTTTSFSIERAGEHDPRIVMGIAQDLEHHHGIGHGGEDRPQPVLAVETLDDESGGAIDGAPAWLSREQRLDPAKHPVDGAEDGRPGLHLMRPLGPVAHPLRRHHEELGDPDAARIARPRLQGHEHEERHQHRAGPIGDLVEMEGKPARQQHDLHRHHRHAAPGDLGEEGEHGTGEDIAGGGPAMGEDRFAGPDHMGRVDGIADHLEGVVSLHAGADIEGALMEQRPAAMGGLDAPEIAGDLRFEREVRRLAEEMLQQDIFGRNRGIGLELEDPMAVLALERQDGLRRPADRAFEIGRRDGWVGN